MGHSRVGVELIAPRASIALQASAFLHVRGRFAGGLYLEGSSGILALTTGRIALTPISARVASDSALPDLPPGEHVSADLFDLSTTRVWSPRPDWAAFDALAFGASADEGRSVAGARLRHEAPAVLAAAETGWLPEALLGLGPGLTPAGDDVLVGRLLAWHAGLVPVGGPTAAIHHLLVNAENRTNRLSLAFLRAAAAGECGQPWHDLWPALGPGSRSRAEAIRVILGTGQTSGAAAFWGFLTAGEAATNDASKRHDPGFSNR